MHVLYLDLRLFKSFGGFKRLLKRFTLTYLGSGAIRFHAGKTVLKRRPLSSMRKSILWAVDLVHVAVEQDSSF